VKASNQISKAEADGGHPVVTVRSGRFSASQSGVSPYYEHSLQLTKLEAKN